jgi:hypothetical protein
VQRLWDIVASSRYRRLILLAVALVTVAIYVVGDIIAWRASLGGVSSAAVFLDL